MSSRKARIELNRLLNDRSIGAARPHTHRAERVMGVRIPGVESDRTQSQFIRLGIVAFLCPAEKGRV